MDDETAKKDLRLNDPSSREWIKFWEEKGHLVSHPDFNQERWHLSKISYFAGQEQARADERQRIVKKLKQYEAAYSFALIIENEKKED